MKANRGPRPSILLAVVAFAALAASCSERRIIPSPAPMPRATPAPVSPRPAKLDWRDAPITPGDWNWAMEGGQSVARFASGALVLRCDRSAGAVILQRGGTAQDGATIAIATSSVTRQLAATAQAGPPPLLAASLAPRDNLLDAMAFSRGRFAVEVAGLPALYVPSWPEISRVVEDCR